jgi:hypothetical protein
MTFGFSRFGRTGRSACFVGTVSLVAGVLALAAASATATIEKPAKPKRRRK